MVYYIKKKFLMDGCSWYDAHLETDDYFNDVQLSLTGAAYFNGAIILMCKISASYSRLTREPIKSFKTVVAPNCWRDNPLTLA